MKAAEDSGLRKAEDMSRFFTFQYQITEKCNLRCAHCYDDDSITSEASTDELIMILNRFLETTEKWSVTPIVPLSGGEPLLSPSFWPLLDHIEEYGNDREILTSVLSNGTLVDRELAERLSTYRTLDFVQISLDGATSKTHEKARGKGTFEKSLQAVSALRDAGIPTHIHYVVHRQNYEEAFEMTDFVRELGGGCLLITRLVPFGRGKEMETLMLTPEEVRELYTKLGIDADFALEHMGSGNPVVHVNRLRCDWPVICTGECLSSMAQLVNKNGNHCQVGRRYIAVMSDGTCYACRRMPVVVGNLLTQNFEEIWNHPFLWKMRRKNVYMKGKCQKCPFNVDNRLNFTCMGGASCISYGTYGDPFMPDPQCSFDPETEAEDVTERVDRIFQEYKKKDALAGRSST
ncbi:MAG: radical SAM protein [Theionarchaea archaeon]|nr:radical SAM protein [Theionarchaea archaeon]MBU7035446.1 radical SAM protein [Theionarchaea archaeon]MBU7041488.1 radical SAM protein [Theionarchaea archaeon]